MDLLAEIGHWALIALLMVAFIATAGHLMGLVVLSRAWKIAGALLAAALVLLTVLGFWLR
jgi:hypothetical protein